MMKIKIPYFKIMMVLGTINFVFESSHVRRHTEPRIYKTLTLPILTYGSQVWTIAKVWWTTIQKVTLPSHCR